MNPPDIIVTGRKLSFSESSMRRNPHVFGPGETTLAVPPADGSAAPVARPARIRQSSKPLMNKLEQAWFNLLSVQYPNYPKPRAQAKRYKIANGAWYKPDVTVSLWPNRNPDGSVRGADMETAWECKGPKQMKNVARGILTIKTAAAQWPEVRFILVWQERGKWCQQEVLP